MRVFNIEITNPSKIIYPKSKTTKLDVINYYLAVGEEMIKRIKNRPLTVIRCHENVNKTFFKKHPTTEPNIRQFTHENESYFYVQTLKDLIYQVQMGTIEFHIWGSSLPNIEKPNLMVFDLDPDEKISLAELRKAVLIIKNELENLNLKSEIKTSGGKGYHIMIPTKKFDSWPIFYNFSKKFAELLQAKYPSIFTTNIRKNQRQSKIFVDYLRNNKGSTVVAPYSLRARDFPTLSLPIEWNELKKYAPNTKLTQNLLKKLKNCQNFNKSV